VKPVTLLDPWAWSQPDEGRWRRIDGAMVIRFSPGAHLGAVRLWIAYRPSGRALLTGGRHRRPRKFGTARAAMNALDDVMPAPMVQQP
jgi:hypothetical protein